MRGFLIPKWPSFWSGFGVGTGGLGLGNGQNHPPGQGVIISQYCDIAYLGVSLPILLVKGPIYPICIWPSALPWPSGGVLLGHTGWRPVHTSEGPYPLVYTVVAVYRVYNGHIPCIYGDIGPPAPAILEEHRPASDEPSKDHRG